MFKAPKPSSASLPAVGNTTGDYRATLNDGKIYRWSGSAWVFDHSYINNVSATSNHDELSNLSGDDHTQYHNDSRASTWLGTKSTADLTEGSNLYYTDARVKTIAASSTTAKIIYVSKDVGNDSNNGSIFKPKLTIQAGITAAEAISAYYNQVIVMVTPSSGGNGYNENLTFSQQGVILQSASHRYRDNSVVIKGNITVNLTGTSGAGNFVAASNSVIIKGFVMTCASGDTITFSGTTFQRLWITDSYIDNTGTGSAIVLTNTGTSGGTKSTITTQNTDINNSNATNPTILLSAGRIFTSGTTYDIQNGNSAGTSIKIDGASATATSSSFTQAGITGAVNVTDNLSTSYFNLCTIGAGTATAVVTPSSPNTGFISLANVGITTSNATAISGSGVLVISGVSFLSTGTAISATITKAFFDTAKVGYLRATFVSDPVALTDAATIATNAALGNVFTVTLGGNRTLGAPTNPQNGQMITYRIRQDATGSRTLAYNAIFRFNTTFVSPTLTTTANATDYLTFIYNSADTKWDCIRIVKA